MKLPEHGLPAQWVKGRFERVAWAISANHGGGYSYRLCKADTVNITEACFQQTPLEFGNSSRVLFANGTRGPPFPIVKTSVGTSPPGSEWARDPVPGCSDCDDFLSKCGAPLPPVPGWAGWKSQWNAQVDCYAMCDGAGSSKALGHCPGKTQFPEALPGLSGFGKYSWPWSIEDTVKVPSHIPPGDYLLSWRWDCEESTQVWQNCVRAPFRSPCCLHLHARLALSL